MSVTRIFINSDLSLNQNVTVNPKTHHYLSNVIRIKKDDKVILFNNDGYCYEAIIKHITRSKLTCNVVAKYINKNKPLNSCNLAISLLNIKRLGYAIEKAVELGVSNIYLIVTKYSQKIISDRLSHRMQHIEQTIIQASQQCARANLAVCHAPQALQDWLQQLNPALDNDLRLVGDHTGQNIKLITSNLIEDSNNIIFIGPEGGLCPEELAVLKEYNFTPVSFGRNILRSETAASIGVGSLTIW